MDAALLCVGRTLGELETELRNVQDELMGGKSVSSWSMGNSAATKNVWLNSPPERRLRLIAEAMSRLDPVAYPPDTMVAITQTRPTFS